MAKAERTIVKKVPNAILYSDGTIRLDNVRLSFPYIGAPSEDENDNGDVVKKFRTAAMLPKKTHTQAKELIKGVIEQIIKDNEAKVPKDKWFLSNGDDSEIEEYAGHFIVTANETRRPSARNRDNSVMTPEEADEKFYGGCWASILIRPWFFDGKSKNSKKSYPKRVCNGLAAVQFVRDDDPFGQGRISDEGVFDEVDDDDSGFDDDDDSGL
jgi:hypothetical protein